MEAATTDEKEARAIPPPDWNAWPPDYLAIYAWRLRQINRFRQDRKWLAGALEYYRTRPADFISHWVDTYDPRRAGSGIPAAMPFVLFKRQRQLCEFTVSLVTHGASGLVEKSRDMGATWTACGLSIWLWLFWPGASVGWGSRKEPLVDRIGDPDSIFEKMRRIIGRLPREFMPKGFTRQDHLHYMKIINPENDATITGESGDSIGRGGRKLVYFKDESAHYERPELIEAALADNTDVQIDISSVNGIGNVFHRRREAGKIWTPGDVPDITRTNVFVMDWSDHPEKDDAWYNRRRQKAVDDGLLHVFEQEVNRNYAASVDGIIIPNEWIKSCIDAHIKLGFDDSGQWVSGVDVADEGGDTNAEAKRKGVVLRSLDEWGARDPGVGARRVIGGTQNTRPIEIKYDSIGVGVGFKTEINNLDDQGKIPKYVTVTPWNAGSGVINPNARVIPGDDESPLNKDFFANLKAQAWWDLRTRCEKTHKAIKEGACYRVDELISLDSSLPLIHQLTKELSQPTVSRNGQMKLVVNKTPDGTKSPNLADAVVIAYCPPVPRKGGRAGVLF